MHNGKSLANECSIVNNRSYIYIHCEGHERRAAQQKKKKSIETARMKSIDRQCTLTYTCSIGSHFIFYFFLQFPLPLLSLPLEKKRK